MTMHGRWQSTVWQSIVWQSAWIVACVPLACSKGDRAPRAPQASQAPALRDEGPPPVIEGDHNLIRNGSFDDGSATPWKASFQGKAQGQARIRDGAYCLKSSAPGEVSWDLQLRHRALRLHNGHRYRVEFTAVADRAVKARPRIAQVGPPYVEYWASTVDVATQPQRYQGHFTMHNEDDRTAELSVHFGGPLVGEGSVEVCIDDVMVADPQYEPPPPPDYLRAPPVRVNQVGYFPGQPKRAVYRSPSATPATWELLDESGAVVASGQTQVWGEDAASGDPLHRIDFSSVAATGSGFTLRVGEARSDPFSIDPTIYHRLKYDAIAYFYHNRSGIEIAMPYAGQPQWARPAGHQSDAKVECLPELGCDYTVDASGGWYDAGDHGKYVVNGGISVWTLLHYYDRTTSLGGDPSAVADGTLSIPEQGNGVPDLLDEVRWELEMLLRFQVPKGRKWEGMAFHKLHEQEWSGLPLAPHEAKAPRYLHRPSTAATLNLAAVAAQAARLWADIDPAFARRCERAARRAWAAAKAHPNLLAPGDDNVGGGPYEDLDVSDEWYWAAVELALATGDKVFVEAARTSPHYLALPGPTPEQGGLMAPMNWQRVQALGTISLATAAPGQTPLDVRKARDAVVTAARAHAGQVSSSGYPVPLAPDAGGTFPWGSNSLVLNNALVLGLAYDLTREDVFLHGVVDALDYLLGRNPMWQSYVTGYGANPLENPHHRFWAHQKDEAYPPPPPGAVSGGPNSRLEDPYAQSAGLPGCPPQKCFVDHIESWSTNEITINWNAPLFWVVAFLDERAR
ncbi:MAG: glycoside hydrolase family 9 protein [Myxococcota bacterium]